MNGKIKKSNNLQHNSNIFKRLKPVLKLCVYAVLLIAAALCMNESSGFFRTLPAMLILPALATLFYNKKTLTIILCFALSLILSAAEKNSVAEAVLTALAALIFASVGILIKRLAVTAAVNTKKRSYCTVFAALLFITGMVGYAFVFGNPASFFTAQAENGRYISETYPNGDLKKCYTYYDTSEKSWFTRVSFRDEAEMSADISAEGGKVVDGYSNYYEYKYLSVRRSELARLLSLSLPEMALDELGQCAVRINPEKTEIAASPNASAESFYSQMVFDIAFYDQLTDEAAFAEKCSLCHERIIAAGFDFGVINYYGGFADEFLFEACVNSGFDGNFESLVQPFSETEFSRYYDEADYADHWSYGKS